MLAAGARACSGTAGLRVGSANTSVHRQDGLVSASSCQGNGMVGPFAGVILMVVRVGSGMVLCSIGPSVAISIE